MIIFTVHFKFDGKPAAGAKTDLQVFVDSPSKNVRVNIMPGAGAFNIGFTPDEPGQYWIDFVLHGKWAKETFCLPIKNSFNKVPDHPYEGKERKAAGK